MGTFCGPLHRRPWRELEGEISCPLTGRDTPPANQHNSYYRNYPPVIVASPSSSSCLAHPPSPPRSSAMAWRCSLVRPGGEAGPGAAGARAGVPSESRFLCTTLNHRLPQPFPYSAIQELPGGPIPPPAWVSHFTFPAI